MTNATMMTRRNMIHDARSVAVTYEYLCSECSVLFLVMATVVAVDEMSPPIPHDTIMPHLLPIMRERRYPAYSTPAMMTTNFQILCGLKNWAVSTGCAQVISA